MPVTPRGQPSVVGRRWCVRVNGRFHPQRSSPALAGRIPALPVASGGEWSIGVLVLPSQGAGQFPRLPTLEPLAVLGYYCALHQGQMYHGRSLLSVAWFHPWFASDQVAKKGLVKPFNWQTQ